MQVLNTFTKSTPSGAFYVLLILFMLAGFLVWLLGADITRFIERRTIGSAVYDHAGKAWMMLLGLVIVMAIFVLPGQFKTRVYAEATIIDNYPIGALYSKYDVVDKRGELWVLELRDSYEEPVEEEVKTSDD